MTKILIVYSGAKYFGGIEAYLTSLFKYYDQKKAKLLLVSLGDWKLNSEIKKSGEKVFVLPRSRIRVKTIKEITDIAEKEKAKLIVSQGVVANFYGRLSAKKAKIPHLCVIHSDIDFDYPDLPKRFLYKLSDELLKSNTKKYITVSKYLKTKLEKKGIDSKNIEVIYHAVNDIGKIKKKRGTEIVIGSIGRLHYTKGYHNLIQALSLLQNLPVTLKIWGEGEEKENLEELVQKYGLTKKVEFAGFEEDRSKIFRQLDIYVQSSLAEGFGLSVVEAMLAEKPIVVTPIGSLPELIRDGNTGLIATDTIPETLAVSLKTLVENEKLATEVAKNARKEAIKRFTGKNWVDKTIEVFLESSK